MNVMMKDASGSQGFTVIELMVTVFVAAVFFGGIVTLVTTYNYFMALARQQSVADDLAYSYVQKYTRQDYMMDQWFTCDGTRKVLEQGSLDPDTVNLPGPVSFRVVANPIYGCGGTGSPLPVKIDARIQYGTPQKTVRHDLFAGGVK